MDNALVPASPTSMVAQPVQPAGTGLLQRLQTIPARMQWMAVAGIVGLVAILVMMFGNARDADYRVLFPNLSEKDGGQVIEKLTLLNVPYRFMEGGGAIMVPAARVHELRMKLAASGLPSGAAGSGGYELLDKNSFGQTQGQERMKMQRAIEGELTTTIQALESVKSARVHLALPNQNGFFREQQKPSASVVLTLHGGRTLDRNQIAGIVRVVSGSVPEMTAKAVSVVDSTGALLSGPGAEEGEGGLDSQQLLFRREIEAGHSKRILDLLEPVVGRDNVRASVSADIDFSQVMQTAEAYRPNQGPDAKVAIRELRTEDANQPGANTAGGVPGATSNQPPTPATAPINGQAQALQGAPGGAAAAAGSARREAATRFEVDKTTTVTKNAAGNVRRLSAAVVVNHRSGTDKKGQPTSTPLSDKEVEQLTALVQQGIGFNAERGDIVKVVNAPFRVPAATPVDETPLWKQAWLIDLLRSAAAPLALAVVALFIVIKLIKPVVNVALAPPPPPQPGTQLSEVVDDDGAALPPPKPKMPLRVLQAPNDSDRLEAARNLAKTNPAAVAHIVRGWVNGADAPTGS